MLNFGVKTFQMCFFFVSFYPLLVSAALSDKLICPSRDIEIFTEGIANVSWILRVNENGL